tara:strand:+ start:37 stop:606 length:570 start_codon:yes stop_codon:yes gene_type:complete
MGRFGLDMKALTRSVMADRQSAVFQKELKAYNREVQQALKVLNKLPNEFTQRRRLYLLRKAGDVIKGKAITFINDKKKPNTRRKKDGTLETFVQGNLRRSMDVMRFRKAKNSVYVGAKIYKKDNLETYGTAKRNAKPYYAHMVEYGTRHSAPNPFMATGFRAGKAEAMGIITKGIKRIAKAYAKKNNKL